MNVNIKSVLINQFVPQTYCFCFTLTDINFGGTLHHVCDMAYDQNKREPIRAYKYRRAN